MNIQEIRDSRKVLNDLVTAYKKVDKAINKLNSVRNVKIGVQNKNWFLKILWRYIKPNLVMKNKKISHHKQLRLDVLNQLSKELYIIIAQIESSESYDKNRVYTLIKMVDEYT